MSRTLFRVGALTWGVWLWLAALLPASAQQQYSIRVLGTRVNEARGINAQSLVTGSHDDTTGNFHAFRWDNGVLRDLGTLGGLFSEGYGINDRGDVVGLAETPAGDYHAYVSLDGGAMRDIDGRPNRYSEAWATNNRGDVVGLAETNQLTRPRTFRAFVWSGSSMQDLGTLGGRDSVGYAINSRGQIAGAAQVVSQHVHGALWDGSQLTDLGVLLGDSYSYGFAINDAGQVAGIGGTSTGTFHPLLWDGGVIRLLTDRGVNGEARGINNRGQVVGWFVTRTLNAEEHAFIWENGTLRDLNNLIPATSGWLLNRATGINDRGQIIGEGLQNGVPRLFLLTPA